MLIFEDKISYETDLFESHPNKKNAFYPLRNPRWSFLTAVGNSPIAKLTLLSPVVAGIIRVKEEFIKSYIVPNFEIPNLVWMYWALISLSIAQICYLLFCPREIKKYGSDRELFILEQSSTTPVIEKLDHKRDYFRTFFDLNQPHLGMPAELKLGFTGVYSGTGREAFEEHLDDSEETKRNKHLNRCFYKNRRIISKYNINVAQTPNTYRFSDERTLLKARRFYNFLHDDKLIQTLPVDEQAEKSVRNSDPYQVCYDVFNDNPSKFLANREMETHLFGKTSPLLREQNEACKRVNRFLKSSITPEEQSSSKQPDWELDMYNWRYHKLDQSKKLSFYISACCYFIGSCFFIFQSIKTMLYVAGVTY